LRFSRLSTFVAGFAPLRINKNLTTNCVVNNAIQHPFRRFHKILHKRICVGRIEKERNHEKFLQNFVESLKGNFYFGSFYVEIRKIYIDHKEISCEVFASIHLAQDGVQNSAFSKMCNELPDFTKYEELIYQLHHHKNLNELSTTWS